MNNSEKMNGKSETKNIFQSDSSAESDWKTLFISWVVLALIVVVASVLMFVMIDNKMIFVTEETPEHEIEKSLDINLLKKTVSHYQEKSIQFEKAIEEGSILKDPSI